MGDYGYRESVMFGFDCFFLMKVKVVIPCFIIFRMMWRWACRICLPLSGWFYIASLSDGRHVIPELAVKGDGEERMKDGGYYTDVVCGKKCFYILSQGDVETSGLSGASSIEVYDYEGNPMKKINLDIISVPYGLR